MALTAEGNWVRSVYGGSLQETVSAQGQAVVTVRSGTFGKPEQDAGRTAPVTEETVETPALRSVIKEAVQELSENVNLEDAEVIVAGGRGMGSAENFQLVHELAALLGGVVGASRPAIEDGWVPRNHQVGQSGKIVAPKLYIACGISGAMQHVSGMSGSGYIVAINKDEDAPIFDVADVGIVGNVNEILPLMIEEIKARKS
jgi:electron transfer flavoprotein alpha subunit